MSEAAAALAGSILTQMSDAPDLEEPPAPQRVEATTPEVVEQPPAEVAPEPEAVAEPAATFDFNPNIPEDIQSELDAADLDAEVEAEVAAYEPPTDEWGNPVEQDGEAVREQVKLRKRLEYLEKQLADSKKKNWAEEAEKFFPLSKHALDSIQATSRRAYLRAAKAEHDRILPHVQGYLAQAKVEVDAERATAQETTRAEVKDAWGKPLTGPDDTAGAEADLARRVELAGEKTRATGSLAHVFREMLRG